MSISSIDTAPEFGFLTCIGMAFPILRDHWFSLVAAAFMREFLALFAGCIVFALFIDLRGWNLAIAAIVRCLMWSALQTGYLRFCLDLCESKVRWSTLFSGFGSSLQMLLATVGLWLAVGLGLVLLVVPGLFMTVRLSLAQLLIVDKNVTALKSLTTSNRMLNGFGWCAAGIMLNYAAGVAVLGWLTGFFEPLMVISLCSLYKHIKLCETDQ